MHWKSHLPPKQRGIQDNPESMLATEVQTHRKNTCFFGEGGKCQVTSSLSEPGDSRVSYMPVSRVHNLVYRGANRSGEAHREKQMP